MELDKLAYNIYLKDYNVRHNDRVSLTYGSFIFFKENSKTGFYEQYYNEANKILRKQKLIELNSKII